MTIDGVKYLIYLVAVLCFLSAGIIDLSQGETKLGVISVGFAVMNGLIFLWRV